MIRIDYVMAFCLLTSAPDALDPPPNARYYASLRPALQTLAIQFEVMDPREMRYILNRPEDYASDLNLLRRRYQDLDDAPLVNDCMRFPSREIVNEILAFNRAYRRHLGIRQPVELAHWWDYRAALQETEYLYQIWDTVRDARCEYYYVTVRRQALKKLRETIGAEAYYCGQLPPYVPLWRFQSMD